MTTCGPMIFSATVRPLGEVELPLLNQPDLEFEFDPSRDETSETSSDTMRFCLGEVELPLLNMVVALVCFVAAIACWFSVSRPSRLSFPFTLSKIKISKSCDESESGRGGVVQLPRPGSSAPRSSP